MNFSVCSAYLPLAAFLLCWMVYGEVQTSQYPLPAIILFAPHKTGSSFIDSVSFRIAKGLNLCHFHEEESAYPCFSRTNCFNETYAQSKVAKSTQFELGCEIFTEQIIQSECVDRIDIRENRPEFCSQGFIWSPVRKQTVNYWTLIEKLKHIPQFQLLLLYQVRHPLDQLVSEYYSFGFTHRPPPFRSWLSKDENGKALTQFLHYKWRIANMSLSDYVVEKMSDEEWWRARYGLIFNYPKKRVIADLKIISYEQMVTDFDGWLLNFKGDWKQSYASSHYDQIISGISAKLKNSFAIDGEHKRFVKPGSHLKELNQTFVAAIYNQFRRKFQLLGYSK